MEFTNKSHTLNKNSYTLKKGVEIINVFIIDIIIAQLEYNPTTVTLINDDIIILSVPFI